MPSKNTVRRYERVAIPKGTPVAWEHMGIRRVSIAKVLALGGLFISTPHPPPVGDAIRVVFEVPGGDVRARASVRTSQPGKGMGIEFKAMKQDARARLNRLMKKAYEYLVQFEVSRVPWELTAEDFLLLFHHPDRKTLAPAKEFLNGIVQM